MRKSHEPRHAAKAAGNVGVLLFVAAVRCFVAVVTVIRPWLCYLLIVWAIPAAVAVGDARQRRRMRRQ